MGKLVLGFCSVSRLNLCTCFPLGVLRDRESEDMSLFILKKSFPYENVSKLEFWKRFFLQQRSTEQKRVPKGLKLCFVLRMATKRHFSSETKTLVKVKYLGRGKMFFSELNRFPPTIIEFQVHICLMGHANS